MARKHNPVHLKSFMERDFNLMDKPLPIDEASAKPVIEKMESAMSPENLHMDGEASEDEVEETTMDVARAKADLETILGRKIELEY